MLESLNYSFRNPKNIIWIIYRIKQLRNYKKTMGSSEDPQLGKQRWRAKLGILRVNTYCFVIILFSCGAAAQRGPWPPHSWGLQITNNDASQSVGFFCGRVISPSQRPLPDNAQHSAQTSIHARGGIPTHNPSKRRGIQLSQRVWRVTSYPLR